MLQAIGAVVFDLDGTLVDSGPVVLAAFRHAYESSGKPFEETRLESLRSKPSARLFEDDFDEESGKKAMALLREYTERTISEVTLYPGIAETLLAIRARGLPMAIWTGRDAGSARRLLESNGIARFFETVVGGCGVERNKPHPEGLLSVAAVLGVEPSRLLMIGDHAHDIEGAKKAGSLSAAALWQSGGISPDFGHVPDVTFRQVAELQRFFCGE